MTKYDYDLFVIGAGSGGVRAAVASARFGARVAVADESAIGGTCVNRGCVPKKLLFYGAQFADDYRSAEAFGWHGPDKTFTWSKLRKNVENEVTRLNKVYLKNLELHGVRFIEARATLTGPHTVTLSSGASITAKIILVATGARATRPNIPGHELAEISDDVFAWEDIPKRLVIIGSGYIANEFAGIFNQFGTDVTVVSRSKTIMNHFDLDVTEHLLEISRSKGVKFCLNAKLKSIVAQRGVGFKVSVARRPPLIGDKVLFAIGRQPNTQGLGLETCGVRLAKSGAIEVNDFSQTTCRSIYAVGDVTDRIPLTPIAIREGDAFAETAFGKKRVRVDYDQVPSAVFSHPPMASVGLTESKARKRYKAVSVHRVNFRPLKTRLTKYNEPALFKIVCQGAAEKIIGMHMVGPYTPELIQIATVIVKAGLNKRAFDAAVALHPTMAEELIQMK